MGNSTSENLQKKYKTIQYQIVDSLRDPNLGNYQVLKFQHGRHEQYCLQRIINPQVFNQTIDERQLISNIKTQNKYLGEFYFHQANVQNRDLIDMIFEYGNTVRSPLEKEKYIWILLQQVLDPLIVFEKQYKHYPLISRYFVIQLDYKEFKLLNPYIFPCYFEDMVKIYLNNDIRISEKREFFYKKRKQNIFEFGCLILSLIFPFDPNKLIQDRDYLKQAFEQIKQKSSLEMINLIKYVLDGNLNKEFWQIMQYIDNNRPKLNKSIFRGIFGDKKKNQSQIQGQEKESLQKKYSIFDSSKQINNYQPQFSNKNNTQPLNYNQKLPITNTNNSKFSNAFSQKQQPTNFQNSQKNRNLLPNEQPQKQTQNESIQNNLSAFYQDDLMNRRDSELVKQKHSYQNKFHNFQGPKPMNKTTFDFSNKNLNQNEQKQQNQTQVNANILNDFYNSKYFNEKDIYQSDFNSNQENSNTSLEKNQNINTQQTNIVTSEQNIQEISQNDIQSINQSQPKIPLLDIKEFESLDSQQNSYQPQNLDESIKQEVINDFEQSQNSQKLASLADQFRNLYDQQEQKYTETIDSQVINQGDNSFVNKSIHYTVQDEYFNDSDDDDCQNQDLNQFQKQNNDSIVQDEENNSVKQQGKVKEHLFQTPEKKINYSGTEETPKLPNLKPTIQQQQPQKKQKTVFYRFDIKSNEYIKVIEYEDGTEEPQKLSEEEQQKIKNMLQNTSISSFSKDKKNTEGTSLQKNQNQQNIKSKGLVKQTLQEQSQHLQKEMFNSDPLNLTEDISITLIDKDNNINFVLVPGQNEVPKLIYRKKIINNETYKELETVVDQKNKLKPSMYHQVEQENKYEDEKSEQVSQNYEYMIQSKIIGSLSAKNQVIGSKNYQIIEQNQQTFFQLKIQLNNIL